MFKILRVSRFERIVHFSLKNFCCWSHFFIKFSYFITPYINILNIFITLIPPPPASSEAFLSCMKVEAIVEEAEEKNESNACSTPRRWRQRPEKKQEEKTARRLKDEEKREAALSDTLGQISCPGRLI